MMRGLMDLPKMPGLLRTKVQTFEHTAAVYLQYPPLKHMPVILDVPNGKELRG
jgi:hypothetical protein